MLYARAVRSVTLSNASHRGTARLVVALVLALAAAYGGVGCVGDAPALGPPADPTDGDAASPPASGAFALQVRSSGPLVVARGSKQTATVEIVRKAFGGAIQFGIAGVVPGVTVSGVAPETTPDAVQEAQITLEAAPDAAQQKVTLRVTGVSGAASAGAEVPLLVRGRAGELDLVELAPANGFVATTRCGTADVTPRAFGVATDGSMYLAGMTRGSSSRACIAKLHANGERDVAFGGGAGHVLLPSGYTLGGIATLPDGAVLAAGTDETALPARRPYVARILASGQLDGSFGTGGLLKVMVPLEASGVGVLPLTGGKLLVLGATVHPTNATKSRGFVVARLDGQTLDPSFGTAGYRAAECSGSVEGFPVAMGIEPSGAIVLAGQAFNGHGHDDWHGFLARLTAGGDLVTSFGPDGQRGIPRVGTAYAFTNGLAVDGSELVVVSEDEWATSRRALRQLSAAGTWSEVVSTQAASGYAGIALDAQKRRVAVGHHAGLAVVERYVGVTLDPSFGTDGRALGPVKRGDGSVDAPPSAFDANGIYRGPTSASAVAFDASGRILVAGPNALGDFAVLRFWP